MASINRSPDCGHSPKNKLLEELAIARWTNDTKTLGELLADDVQWNVIGQAKYAGRDAVLTAILESWNSKIRQLEIIHVSSHGKIGSVNGRLALPNGKQIDFCDVCEFANSKGTTVSEITSYILVNTNAAAR